MRAWFTRLRLPVLLGLLAALPLALGALGLDARMVAARRAQAARSLWQLRLARTELTALLARDRAVLAGLDQRPGLKGGAAGGGIVAAFVTDAAGRIPPGRIPARLPRRGRGGNGWSIGATCPVPATAGAFVLFAANPDGRGWRGVCIDPGVLVPGWRKAAAPGGTLALRRAGRVLLRVGPARGLAWRAAPGGFALGFAPAPPRWPPGWPDGTLALLALTLLAATALPALTLAAARAHARARDSAADAGRFAEVLRMGAERHRQGFVAAPVALLTLDAGQRVLAVNDALLRLTGQRRETLLGQPITGLLANADRPGAEQDLMRALGGDTAPPAARRLRRRDGPDLRVNLPTHVERGADGLVRRIHLAVLPAAADPAAERHEALARVVGGVAHDFNNLLMVLIGNLERLIGQAERPDAVRRLAGLALRAAERGATLTARLLAAAGTQKLRPELVNPNRLLRESEAELAAAAGTGVAVQLVLSPLLDPVRLDRDGFRAVALALVANARAAIAAGGGGRLTVETANRPGGSHVAIGFADTGMGMTPEVLAQATEPFFTTRPPGTASGLGLSVADGFARQSGGWLELRSEPGIGTTVTLVLPRPETAGRPTAPSLAPVV